MATKSLHRTRIIFLTALVTKAETRLAPHPRMGQARGGQNQSQTNPLNSAVATPHQDQRDENDRRNFSFIGSESFCFTAANKKGSKENGRSFVKFVSGSTAQGWKRCRTKRAPCTRGLTMRKWRDQFARTAEWAAGNSFITKMEN